VSFAGLTALPAPPVGSAAAASPGPVVTNNLLRGRKRPEMSNSQMKRTKAVPRHGSVFNILFNGITVRSRIAGLWLTIAQYQGHIEAPRDQHAAVPNSNMLSADIPGPAGAAGPFVPIGATPGGGLASAISTPGKCHGKNGH
jgi:hypothetical protein